MIDIAPAVAAELRAVLDEADVIRNRLDIETVPDREWMERALSRIETAARRVLHLVGA